MVIVFTAIIFHGKISLFSFIGLVNFYHRYAPYMEIKLKPLRALVKKFYQKEIPTVSWTSALVKLFADLKICITSAPVLARFDTTRPTFLKTDWSSEGMGWILMQPANDDESQAASRKLLTSGECEFDLSKNGARLQPIAFGSRSCTLVERNFHSFTDEAASGRWSIEQNRKYLWGSYFWWICNCLAVEEVLEYDGTIPLVCRWAQELLGYQFTIVHRPNRMMANVDSLTRRYGPLIAIHYIVSSILYHLDNVTRPLAYEPTTFYNSATAKLTPPVFSAASTPVLHNGYITATCKILTV